MRRNERIKEVLDRGPWKFAREEEGDFISALAGLPGKYALVFANDEGEEIKVGKTAAEKYLNFGGDNSAKRVQVILDNKTYTIMSKLAERMRVSESKMCAMLLEEAIGDNEWATKFVTSRALEVARDIFGGDSRNDATE